MNKQFLLFIGVLSAALLVIWLEDTYNFFGVTGAVISMIAVVIGAGLFFSYKLALIHPTFSTNIKQFFVIGLVISIFFIINIFDASKPFPAIYCNQKTSPVYERHRLYEGAPAKGECVRAKAITAGLPIRGADTDYYIGNNKIATIYRKNIGITNFALALGAAFVVALPFKERKNR